MTATGVVVLHHDVAVLEQVVEAIEAAPDLFVAATSIDAGARAAVVVAGGEALLSVRSMPTPLVALAEGDSVRAARAALTLGARDIVRWPDERDRIAPAVRRAVSAASVREPAGDVTVVAGARGGLGTSTVAAAFAAARGERTLVLDLDGGQRAFAPDDVEQVVLPADPDPDLLERMSRPHALGTKAIHLEPHIDRAAARSLLRAARRAAPAVVVDAGREVVGDHDLLILMTGCDVASVRRAKALLGENTIVVVRRTRYSLGKRDVEAALGRPCDLVIGEDPAVARAADLGRLPGRANKTMRAIAKLAKAAR